MARCHTCDKYLGLGLFSHWTKLDRRNFCLPCGEDYFQLRRATVLEEIRKGGHPRVIFNVPRVWTANPDRRSGRERLVGQAAFTDKGICFIHMGQHLDADPGMAAAFGLIGAAIAASKAAKERKRALQQAEDLAGQAKDLPELMDIARQVVFYPLDQVWRLKFDSKGFNIWHGKRRTRFGFDGGRKAFGVFKEAALSYAADVTRGVKPAPLPWSPAPPGA